MELDYTARRNLELTASLHGGEKKGSLLWVLDKTRTAMGGRLIRSWLEKPLLDVAQITRRQNAVEAFVNDFILREQLEKQLSGVNDMERIASRIVYGCGAPLVMLPCLGVVSTFTTTGPELDYWLRGKNALCDFLVKNTVDEVKHYAEGKVWSRVLWDVTAVGWLLNDDHRFLHSRMIPTPVPEYDHHWGSAPLNPLCRYVYHVNRDALLGDLFGKLVKGGPKA